MTTQEMILQVLKEKSSLKQDIYQKNINWFKSLRDEARELAKELRPLAAAIDKRLLVEFTEKAEFEFELRVAGDVLIFSMHTNIFEFDTSHHIWQTQYVRDNEARSYCGMISIYNFLSDSFTYNRVNDLGYLVARVFINLEDHFFVEGKTSAWIPNNDFATGTVDKVQLRTIVEAAVLYCLDFDLFTPPLDEVKVISLAQIQESSAMISIKTGKRLGFRFQADSGAE